MTTYYIAIGSVRGRCGHRHKSIQAAHACVLRDQRGCRQVGGYSDRVVERSDGEPLSDAQLDTLLYYEQAAER